MTGEPLRRTLWADWQERRAEPPEEPLPGDDELAEETARRAYVECKPR